MEILTKRLRIRKFTPEDWQDLYEYLSDEAVVKFEPYGVFNKDQCKQEATSRSHNEAFFAVCLKDTGKVIGNLYFAKQEFDTWELGYVFNAKYQGLGYATESAKAMLEEGFTHMGVRRVVAMCNPVNEASWKLLERLSMRREGQLKENIFFTRDVFGNPIWQDTYEYAILRSEWF